MTKFSIAYHSQVAEAWLPLLIQFQCLTIAEAFLYSLKYSVAIEHASVDLAQAHPITLPHWTTGKNQQGLAVGTAKCVHMAEYWPTHNQKIR